MGLILHFSSKSRRPQVAAHQVGRDVVVARDANEARDMAAKVRHHRRQVFDDVAGGQLDEFTERAAAQGIKVVAADD